MGPTNQGGEIIRIIHNNNNNNLYFRILAKGKVILLQIAIFSSFLRHPLYMRVKQC